MAILAHWTNDFIPVVCKVVLINFCYDKCLPDVPTSYQRTK